YTSVIARIAPAWMPTLNRSERAPSQCSAINRCPVEEIGRNSVMPSMMPRMMTFRRSCMGAALQAKSRASVRGVGAAWRPRFVAARRSRGRRGGLRPPALCLLQRAGSLAAGDATPSPAPRDSRSDATAVIFEVSDMVIDAQPRYTRTAIFLHWLILALLIAQYAIAWTMPHIGRNTPVTTLISLHFSIGVLILGVIVVRLIWRIIHGEPAHGAGVPPWQVRSAR